MTGQDGLTSKGTDGDGDGEPSAQSILRWLNANIIYPAPKEWPSPVIHVHIDKVILASDKPIIGQVRELIMGDHFEKIGAEATIINRSALSNSLNRTHCEDDGAAAQALQKLAQIIEECGNLEAAENLNALTAELAQPQPRKALVKSFWNGIVAVLPGVAKITEIADHMSQLYR
jgi:hypothetical protein